MPVNNALAESISTGQSEDPFKKILEYGQIGQIGVHNRLMEAQIGEAGARAGEAGAAAAYTNDRRTKLLPAEISEMNARTGSAKASTENTLAEAEKNRAATAQLHMDIYGRLAQKAKTDPTYGPDDFDQDSQSAGGKPMDPGLKQSLKNDPAKWQAFVSRGLASGVSTQQYLQPHPTSETGGYRTIAQETAPPAPAPAGAAPAPAAGLGQAAMTPAEKLAQTNFVGPETKGYTSNQNLMQRMTVIDHNIDQLGPNWMGAGSDTKAAIAKTWNGALDTAGVEGFHINPEKVATWEDFNKETTRAGMELIKSNFGGSREAASIIQMGRTAVPNNQNTFLGAKYVSATIKAATQWQMGLYEYKKDLLDHGKPLAGAEAEYAKAHPPEDNARGAIVSVIPKESKTKLMAGASPQVFDSIYGPGMAQYVLSHPQQ